MCTELRSGQPAMPARAGAESRAEEPQPVETGLQAGLQRPGHMCSQKPLGRKGAGAHGVLFTDSPANTTLSLHPPRPNSVLLLRINPAMGDVLKDPPGCRSSSAGLAVREQGSVQGACHSDTHAWLSITLAPVGAVWDQAEPKRPQRLFKDKIQTI